MQKGHIGLILIALVLIGGLALAVPQLEVQSFSYDPAPAIPGSKLSVWLQVKNNSSENFNDGFVKLKLDDITIGRGNFPFNAPIEELTKSTSIQPFQTVTLRYVVDVSPQALSGNYKVTVSMGKGDSTYLEVAKMIDIVSRKPKIEIIDAPITQYKPGSQFEFPLKIKNLGSARAINILVGVDEDRTVTSTGTVVERPINSIGNSLHFVDEIEPLEETTVSLSLAIDNTAEVRTYTVPVTIQWQDENRNDYTETRIVGIRVIKEPDIDVSLGEIKLSETQKGVRELNVDIFNKGASTAKNVIANISIENGELLSASKVFIGTLESDDFDSFKNLIKLDQNTNTQVKMVITFSNANDESITIERTIAVPAPTSAETGSGNGFDLIGTIALLVIGGLIGWFGHHHTNKRKE